MITSTDRRRIAPILAAALTAPLIVLGYQTARLEVRAEHLRRQRESPANPPARQPALDHIPNAGGESPDRREATLAQWQAANAELWRQLAEVEKKRAEFADRRQPKGEAGGLKVPLPPDMIPPGALRDTGRDTPAATVQTVAWAMLNRNLQVLTDSLALEPEDEADLRALFASLPEETQIRVGSAERLTAIMRELLGHRTSLTLGRLPLQIREVQTLSDARAASTVQVQLPSGETRTLRMRLRRFQDGWRLIVPSDEVQLFVSTLSNLPPAQWKFIGR